MAGINTTAVTSLQNSSVSPITQSGGSELSQVDFMKLIIAQMRNQNPLDPQSDSDFMAQMAQFESLNQMRTMADSMKVLQGVNELSSAAGMIGRTVTGRLIDGTAIMRDTVAREVYGAPYLQLTSSQRVTVNSDERVKAALNETNIGGEVSGRVDRVAVGPDGIPMLVIGDKVVDLFTVGEVR